MTKSSPHIRLQILNENGLLIAQFSRYQFIPSAKLPARYISRPFLFKIYGCDLVINLFGHYWIPKRALLIHFLPAVLRCGFSSPSCDFRGCLVTLIYYSTIRTGFDFS